MKINKQKIVIVGGGFGGVKTALELSKNDIFDITLISDIDTLRYYPSFYHTATGGSRTVSSIPINEILLETNTTVVIAKVTALDRALKIIKTDDGQEYGYDYLVLAMGVSTNYFGIPGLREYAYGIKTLEDAEKLKAHLHQQIIDEGKPDLNYVVVGGGPSGIELAGVLGDYVRYICNKHAIAQRTIHVDLIEAAPRLVPRMPTDISKKIAKQLRSRGVKLYLGAAVQAESADELIVNGKPIRSHTVIWTAGVSNNSFFAEQNFQTVKNGKVRVDQYMQAEPSIFVIGDNADTPYSGMAQTAIHDAIYVANSLVTMTRDKTTPKPYVAKKPIYVMPAGPNYAAVLWGSVKLYGRIGWSLRRVADLAAYKDYEPVFKTAKTWLAEYEQQDQCLICQPDAMLVPDAATAK